MSYSIQLRAGFSGSFFFMFTFLLTSHLNAQEWINDYDILFNEYQNLHKEYKFQESADALEAAILLAETNDDLPRLFDAFISHKEALLKLEQSVSVLPALHEFEETYFPQLTETQRSKINSTIAWGYYNNYEYENSFAATQSALEYAIASNDSARFEEAYRIMAFSRYALGNYDSALSLVDKAIDYNQGSSYFLGVMQYCLYFIYHDSNQRQKALPYLYNSYEIALETDDKYLLTIVLSLLAYHYIDNSEMSKSIRYAEEGADIAKTIGHKSRLASLYDVLSIAYSFSNDPERSLFYSEQAYNIYKELGDKFDEIDALVSMGLSNLYLGNHEKFRTIAAEAFEYYLPRADTFHIAQLYTILAESDIARSNFESAKQNLDLAMVTIDDSGRFKYLKAAILHRYMRLPDTVFPFEQKLNYAPELLRSSTERGILHYLQALVDVSRMYRDTNPDSAMHYAQQASQILEQRRFEVSGGKLRANSFSEHFEFYQEAGSWHAIYNEDYATAFEYFQKAKSRLLLDELAESHKTLLAEQDSTLIMELIGLQKEIDQLYLSQRSSDSSLSIDLLAKENEYNLKLDDVKRSDPNWSEYAFPKPSILDEAQNLLDHKTAIIEYGLIKDQLLIFFISRNDVEFIASDRVPGLKDSLSTYINDFRDGIISEEDLAELEQLSSPLLKLLVDPVFDRATSFSNLVIIPDGSISLLPFEALVHNGEYLIKDFATKYLPSLSVFEQIKNPFRKTNSNIFAIAGSHFEFGKVGLSPTRPGYISLPFTLLEVDSVSSHFKNPTVLKNHTKAEEVIKSSNLSNYKYLHFATHAEIDEALPDQSGLFLTRKIELNSGIEEDGFLNTREIKNLKLNADLVVLSACNTATGKVISGEGLMSINRAFLVAGASSVISGLWNIYDRSTHEFMKVFYDNLLEFEDREISWFDKISIWRDRYEPSLIDHKTLALHQTKLEMMEHPYYSHPVHWASFVITGK